MRNLTLLFRGLAQFQHRVRFRGDVSRLQASQRRSFPSRKQYRESKSLFIGCVRFIEVHEHALFGTLDRSLLPGLTMTPTASSHLLQLFARADAGMFSKPPSSRTHSSCSTLGPQTRSTPPRSSWDAARPGLRHSPLARSAAGDHRRGRQRFICFVPVSKYRIHRVVFPEQSSSRNSSNRLAPTFFRYCAVDRMSSMGFASASSALRAA